MIDTHCHLLHGLDDGPSDSTAAVRLAEALAAAGVSTVVCTPHYSRRYPTPDDEARERLRELRESLEASAADLDLRVAAEVSPAFALTAPLDELRRRSIANRFLIVEVLPDTPGPFFETASARFDGDKLVAVFAHPERCRAAQRRPSLLAETRDAGALLQVVAPSVTGRWGVDIERLAWSLLEEGRADLLGSDAHSLRRGASELEHALTLATVHLGEERVRDLVTTTPALLLEGVHPRERG
jgi:protein-tyrosine phosphatase